MRRPLDYARCRQAGVRRRVTERNHSLRERASMISSSWADSPVRTDCRPICSPSYLVECGRPMLIAAARAPHRLGTIMVAWKDAREPARALTAAMPLLTEAGKVVVAEVVEGAPS